MYFDVIHPPPTLASLEERVVVRLPNFLEFSPNVGGSLLRAIFLYFLSDISDISLLRAIFFSFGYANKLSWAINYFTWWLVNSQFHLIASPEIESYLSPKYSLMSQWSIIICDLINDNVSHNCCKAHLHIYQIKHLNMGPYLIKRKWVGLHCI